MSRAPEPEVAGIRDALAAAGHPWQAGTNRMNRLPDHWRRTRLGVPAHDLSPNTADHTSLMTRAAHEAAGLPVVVGTAPTAKLPAAFDLRDVDGDDYVTPIRDQGACRSSVAFATVAALESTAAFTRGAPGLDLDLSEAHLFHGHARARAHSCESGSWPDELFSDAVSQGVTFEDYFPYGSNSTGTADPDWPNRLANAVGLTNLTGNPAAIKRHIYGYGPVVACLVVHDDLFHYTGGVYRNLTPAIAGGHCVALVGWDDHAGCWIAKNSWGRSWGEGGFLRIAYGDSFIERYPVGRPTVLGCTAVSLRAWLPAQQALRHFATANDAKVWAYLEHLGWAPLGDGPPDSPDKLAMLARAQTDGHPVTPYVDGDELSTVHVGARVAGGPVNRPD